MPTTPKLALPYPTLSDSADVPRDIQALATKIDGITFGASLVTSLPASPADGQECHYLADNANGLVWHLRYRAASSSAYKWEVVGGSPLTQQVDALVTSTSSTFTALAGGPSITVPLAGDYLVGIGATTSLNASSQSTYMTYTVGAVAADNTDGINLAQPTSVIGTWASLAHTRRKNAIAAAAALVAVYAATGGGTGSWQWRWMNVMPIRVG